MGGGEGGGKREREREREGGRENCTSNKVVMTSLCALPGTVPAAGHYMCTSMLNVYVKHVCEVCVYQCRIYPLEKALFEPESIVSSSGVNLPHDCHPLHRPARERERIRERESKRERATERERDHVSPMRPSLPPSEQSESRPVLPAPHHMNVKIPSIDSS